MFADFPLFFAGYVIGICIGVIFTLFLVKPHLVRQTPTPKARYMWEEYKQ